MGSGSAALSSNAIRVMRDRILAASDFTQMPDYPISDAARAAWAEYRQALRDLPADPTVIRFTDFPVAPGPLPRIHPSVLGTPS